MISLSSGLRNAIMGYHGLAAMMQLGHIQIYTGTRPPNADHSPTGTLIARISGNGDVPIAGYTTGGLNLSAGILSGEIVDSGDWVLVGLNNGQAGWWRMVWNSLDDGQHSNFYPRIDGDISDSLFIPNTSIIAGTSIPVTQFTIALPAQ